METIELVSDEEIPCRLSEHPYFWKQFIHSLLPYFIFLWSFHWSQVCYSLEKSQVYNSILARVYVFVFFFFFWDIARVYDIKCGALYWDTRPSSAMVENQWSKHGVGRKHYGHVDKQASHEAQLKTQDREALCFFQALTMTSPFNQCIQQAQVIICNNQEMVPWSTQTVLGWFAHFH